MVGVGISRDLGLPSAVLVVREVWSSVAKYGGSASNITSYSGFRTNYLILSLVSSSVLAPASFFILDYTHFHICTPCTKF